MRGQRANLRLIGIECDKIITTTIQNTREYLNDFGKSLLKTMNEISMDVAEKRSLK